MLCVFKFLGTVAKNTIGRSVFCVLNDRQRGKRGSGRDLLHLAGYPEGEGAGALP
jgi:hypothetical protein